MSKPNQACVVERTRGQRIWQIASITQGSRGAATRAVVGSPCARKMQKRITPISNTRVIQNMMSRMRRVIAYAVAASSFLRKENITTPEMTQRAIRTVQLTQSGTLSQSIDGMELR